VPDAELWLLGEWESDGYRNLCAALPGYTRVRYFGQKPLEETYAICRCADVGVINFLPVANHVEALPNKLYEYMACGLPMVLSDFPFWRAQFEEIALFADPTDTGAIAGALNRLRTDPALRDALRTAGAKRGAVSFSWESEATKLLKLYERLLAA
jgi:glycosyltransferase involved in cell wall biosynthesis